MDSVQCFDVSGYFNGHGGDRLSCGFTGIGEQRC
jgi:hypothetical protein